VNICEACVALCNGILVEGSSAADAAPAEAKCAEHPKLTASSTCARCGQFIGGGCERWAHGFPRRVCRACVETVEANQRATWSWPRYGQRANNFLLLGLLVCVALLAARMWL
jgi:hypothetical protein